MQELVGRLTALDPQASETLKVVSYFDALVGGEVGLETIVRGAAALTGVPAGLCPPSGAAMRVSPEGDRLQEPDAARWPSIVLSDDSVVWVEREGAAHANDAMVLERFALAVSVTRARRRTTADDAVAVVIDATRTREQRASAAALLGLSPLDRVRICVSSAASAPLPGPSTLVATSHGVVRATIVRSDPPVTEAFSGRGLWGAPDSLDESWATAVVAYRLCRVEQPSIDAEDLGILIAVVRALEGSTQRQPDVTAIERLDERSRGLLRALVEAESVRAASASLGMHHSTLQARHASFVRELGYDPRSAVGRARYEVAEMLRRLG